MNRVPSNPAARLVTVQGRGAGTAFVLGPANTLGRDPENTIQVLDEKISRHHAVLRRSDGVWTLQDLGSRNGTFLRGERLGAPIELKGGEEIHFGDTVLRFELVAEGAGPAPMPIDPLEPLEIAEPAQRPALKPAPVAPAPPVAAAAAPPILRSAGPAPGLAAVPAPVPVAAPAPPARPAERGAPISIRNLPDRTIDLESRDINPVVKAAADASGRALFKLDQGGNAGDLARRLEVVFEINKALSQLMELEDLSDSVLEELFKAVPATRGAVLVNQGDGELAPVAIREPGKGRAAAKRIPISRALLSRALSRREAVLMTDVLADSDLAGSASIVAQGVQSAITAPLIYQDELLGVLHLENRSAAKAFSKEDLTLVASVAAQAAVAVANSRLLAKVKQEAGHRENLQRYLAPELVEQLLAGKLNLEMEGSNCHVTVLFSDLRGFTAMSEQMQSREVFQTLNAYFQLMVDVIGEFGGSVDKFIGDAIMAVWGIPEPRDDDARRAVAAAIKMQQALEAFNLERENQARPPLHMGIGINSGPALAGNLGARQRRQYTVIGDTVNMASRIEGLTKAGQVLISEAVMASVRSLVEAEELPPAKVKGKQHPVKVFEVKGLRTAPTEQGVSRAQPRLKTAVKVVMIAEPSGTTHTGLLADISAGGAGVKMVPEQIKGLESGMTVRLPFGGAADPGAPAVRGKIVRLIHGTDPAGNVLFKAGIQFLDPPDQVKELAKSLVKL